MYQYEDHVDISPEQLLQKVTQEQIFEFILGLPFSFTDRYISPLRIDTKPGCRFEQRQDGTILFVDFNDPFKTHRTCFSMLMDKHKVTLTGAINMLVKEFRLSGNKTDYEAVAPTTSPLLSFEAPTNPVIITYRKVMFSRRDRKFWNQFLITEEDLLEDNVFPTDRVTIKNTRKKKSTTFSPVSLCYAIDLIGSVKIYQPYNSQYKWLSNCDEDRVGNFDSLPLEGEEVVIASGYKDHRVLRNMSRASKLRYRDNVVWFQNEGCIPDMLTLESLTKRFDVITIFYDSDLAGVRAARKLQKVFNGIRSNCCRMVFIPRSQVIYNRYGYYLKDPGMYVHKEGRQEFSKILNQIL